MIPPVSAPVAASKSATQQITIPPASEKPRAPLEKDRPTGPPPAFDESFLARQAREALTPAELPRDADRKGDPKSSPQGRAESGFAEIRALAGEPAKPLVDKRS